jgi:hypothetical protein
MQKQYKRLHPAGNLSSPVPSSIPVSRPWYTVPRSCIQNLRNSQQIDRVAGIRHTVFVQVAKQKPYKSHSFNIENIVCSCLFRQIFDIIKAKLLEEHIGKHWINRYVNATLFRLDECLQLRSYHGIVVELSPVWLINT